MPTNPEAVRRAFSLLREMSTLDLESVVRRSREVIKEIAEVDRALLVDVGADETLAPFLEPSDSPRLEISRSSIEEAVRTRKPVEKSVESGKDIDLSESFMNLRLQRVVVHPIVGPDGDVIAVAYMDSRRALRFDHREPGEEHPTNWLLDAILQQLGYSLRNASLHAALSQLNATLEQKVRDRTRQLEESRTQLVAQDRLVTLGRLVAAIAHEINNPVGAIVSFAQTLREQIGPLLRLYEDLDHGIADEAQRAIVRQVVERILSTTDTPALDTRRRRERERSLESVLTTAGLASASFVARRLARLDLDEDVVRTLVPALEVDVEAVVVPLTTAHTVNRSLGSIGTCARTLERIVRGLKTYSHLDRAEKEIVDLHAALRATVDVLSPTIPAGVEVTTDFAALPEFAHYPGELAQVWTNLIDNAVRAMGEVGRLCIRTRKEGNHAVVEIEDTGGGIDPALAARIFELDVTSRGPGAGLGLGLPICRAIVQHRHGGTIEPHPIDGGTCFRVRLPFDSPELKG